MLIILLKNKTTNALEIISFEDGVSSRKVEILPNSTFSELSICDWGGWAIEYNYLDSFKLQ